MRLDSLIRNRFAGLVLRAGLLGFCGSVPASGAPGPEAPAPFRDVRADIERQVAEGRAASVAVAVVKDDAVAWAEGFGLADRRAGRKATPDSIYRLASVSKPITATGLMVLVERGRIDLDAPANRYLPGSQLRAPLGSADAMTVRRLANHTSGLPVHYNFFYDGQRPPSMDETVARYGFASKPPGEAGEYSNLGFGILGYITEVVSGTPWRSFMEKEVYDPLGMTRTSDRVRPGLEADAAVPYTKDVAGRFVPVGDYDFDHPGASAVWSSANDLARFARAHLRGGELDGVRVLGEAATRAMQGRTGDRGEGTGTGIGWALSTERGRRCVSHGGGMPGVATLLRLYPDDGIATVVLVNNDETDLPRRVADRLARVLFPEDAAPPDGEGGRRPAGKPDEVPASLKGTWTGKLAHPDGDIALTLDVQGPAEARATFGDAPSKALRDVSMRRGRLFATLEGRLSIRPQYHGPTVLEFQLNPRGDRLTGVVAADGPGYFHLPHWADLARKPGGDVD